MGPRFVHLYVNGSLVDPLNVAKTTERVASSFKLSFGSPVRNGKKITNHSLSIRA